MALNAREMWSNGIKKALFPNNYKKSPCGWGLAPRPPSVRRLSYVSLLNTLPTLNIFAFWILVQAF